MNKIYLKIRNAALVAAVAAAGTSVANAYTAEDLCGKIVGQVFFQNGTLGSGLPSANNDGEFTKQGNYLVLSRFRDSKDVKFELVNGTKLRLVKGSYQNIDDNAYTQIKTARLNSTYDSYYGETYYCFDLTSSSNWEGTISEVGDGLGTLKVTFQGNASSNLLQFRGQSSWGVNLETMNDNLHTYDKVEFFIYPYNATMTTTDGDGNTYTTNLMVATTTPENNKSQILIRNWPQGGGGFGYNYSWGSTGSNSSTNSQMPYKYEYNTLGGVWGTLDYNTGTLTIDDQGVSAFAIMDLEFQDYPYWLDWKAYYPGNLFLCQTCDSYGNNATAVTGTFVETLEHKGNTYWHPNCGGDLKTVYKTGFTMSPWRVFKDFDQSRYRGVLTSGTATSMSIEEDQTFDAAISSVTIAHDPANDYTEELDPVSGQMVKKGFYRVKVKMGNFVNKDNVDYVDLYCIEGSHTHCGTVSHADGVGHIGSVGVSAPAASLGEFPVYPSIIRDAEGNPVYENGKVKVNKDLTFYLKAHYKTSASSAPGEKTAAPLESTFHALTTRTANDITTAVDLNEATGLNVEDVEGGIIVHAEGNAAVQVYNMGGMLVAAGNTNETIAIDATGVMVVRVSGKVFKIMK